MEVVSAGGVEAGLLGTARAPSLVVARIAVGEAVDREFIEEIRAGRCHGGQDAVNLLLGERDRSGGADLPGRRARGTR